VHSTPRKKRRRVRAGIEPERPAWPTHSRLGNPYPRGLEPAVIDDINWEDLEQAVTKADTPAPGGDTYEYLYVEPDPQLPRLKLKLASQRQDQTDEQYASYRRHIEEFTSTHAIYLGLCQLLCTHLGNHHACSEGPCRRNAACSAIRDQDRFHIPLVLFPPCVPLDHEIIETYRQELIAELKRIVARGNEGRPKAESATAGRRPPKLVEERRPRGEPAAGNRRRCGP
jgi:hypothetical protein